MIGIQEHFPVVIVERQTNLQSQICCSWCSCCFVHVWVGSLLGTTPHQVQYFLGMYPYTVLTVVVLVYEVLNLSLQLSSDPPPYKIKKKSRKIPANHMYGHSMLVIGGFYHTESLRTKGNSLSGVPQKKFQLKKQGN